MNREELFSRAHFGCHLGLPLKQDSHDGKIGIGKIITVKIRRVNPADLLVIVELEISGYVCGPVGQQIDFNVGVGMTASTDEAAYDHIDTELLPEFPSKANLGGLALFDLSARKFPFILQAIATLAAGNENPAVFFQDGGSYRDSSERFTGGHHPLQTLTTRQDLVKSKTLESGVDLWNKGPSFGENPTKNVGVLR
jgi:hypothetical protein